MNCPECNRELRVGGHIKESEETTIIYVCVNRSCNKFEQEVEKVTVPKTK